MGEELVHFSILQLYWCGCFSFAVANTRLSLQAWLRDQVPAPVDDVGTECSPEIILDLFSHQHTRPPKNEGGQVEQ